MLASQRACNIPEIIHGIVSEFGPGHLEPVPFPERHLLPTRRSFSTHGWVHYSDDRKTLANVARCNKQFAGIALEILWRMQTSIVPLLSLIPSFERVGRKYEFTDAISSESWKRVEFYARRIRIIYSECSAEVQDHVFVQLAQRLKEKPLLPRLYSLSYPISAEIFIFIVPSLRSVNITESTGLNKGPFLSALFDTAPLLEELKIDEFSVPFPKSLPNFSWLKMLDIGSYEIANIASLNCFFSCTHLTELHVSLAKFRSDTEFELDVVVPLLRKLTLYGHPASIHYVLKNLGSTPLTALRLTYPHAVEESWEAQWRARLNLVTMWSSSLEVLELEEDSEPCSADFLEPSIMDQLLQMTRLKYVKLNFYPIVDFNDAYMNKIARAWTGLRSLDIRSLSGIVAPSTTIASLEAFATHCPHLHSLSLRINLQPSNLGPRPRCNLSHSLKRLFIQYPISGDIALIARHLFALFPGLQDVDGADGDVADIEDCENDEWKEWDDVQDMIRLCQTTVEDYKIRQKKP